MLKKWSLGERGYDYIYKELQRGSTLARLIGRSPLAEGVCETLLPEEIDGRSIVDLSTSAYLSVGTSLQGTRKYIDGIVRKYLQNADIHCVIIETFLQPADFSLIERNEPYFFFKNEVYYFLRKGLSNENITSAILDARAYPKIVIFSRHDKMIQKGDILDEKDFNQLAENVDMLIIGAFDEEGFVYWSKKDQLQME